MRPTPQYQTVLTLHFIIRGITPVAHLLVKRDDVDGIALTIFVLMDSDVRKHIIITITNACQVAALLELLLCRFDDALHKEDDTGICVVMKIKIIKASDAMIKVISIHQCRFHLIIDGLVDKNLHLCVEVMVSIFCRKSDDCVAASLRCFEIVSKLLIEVGHNASVNKTKEQAINMRCIFSIFNIEIF